MILRDTDNWIVSFAIVRQTQLHRQSSMPVIVVPVTAMPVTAMPVIAVPVTKVPVSSLPTSLMHVTLMPVISIASEGGAE